MQACSCASHAGEPLLAMRHWFHCDRHELVQESCATTSGGSDAAPAAAPDSARATIPSHINPLCIWQNPCCLAANCSDPRTGRNAPSAVHGGKHYLKPDEWSLNWTFVAWSADQNAYSANTRSMLPFQSPR